MAVIHNQPTISPKRAVEIAKTYLKQLIQTQDIQLEEIEHSDGFWYVTLSFPANQIEEVFGIKSQRKYRVLSIDSITGTVNYMKIRKLN